MFIVGSELIFSVIYKSITVLFHINRILSDY